MSGDSSAGAREIALRIVARAREDLERQINAEGDERRNLAAEVRELAKVVQKLGAKPDGEDEQPPTWHWDDLDEPDRSDRWNDFEQWLGDVLAATHPTVHALLPDCWRHHPPVVAAVTATWFAWHGAYRAKSRRPDDPIRFTRDALPVLTTAVKTEWATSPTVAPRRPCQHHATRSTQ